MKSKMQKIKDSAESHAQAWWAESSAAAKVLWAEMHGVKVDKTTVNPDVGFREQVVEAYAAHVRATILAYIEDATVFHEDEADFFEDNAVCVIGPTGSRQVLGTVADLMKQSEMRINAWFTNQDMGRATRDDAERWSVFVMKMLGERFPDGLVMTAVDHTLPKCTLEVKGSWRQEKEVKEFVKELWKVEMARVFPLMADAVGV